MQILGENMDHLKSFLDSVVTKPATALANWVDYVALTKDEYEAAQKYYANQNKPAQAPSHSATQEAQKAAVVQEIQKVVEIKNEDATESHKKIEVMISTPDKKGDNLLMRLLKLEKFEATSSTNDPYFDSAQKIIESSTSEKLKEKDINGNTVLHLATARHAFQTIDFILRKAPFIINEQNNEGDTALHIAALQGSSREKTTNLLLQKGADLKIRNKCHQTAFYNMVFSQQPHRVTLDNMLKKENNPHQLGGRSPVYAFALNQENQDILNLLIENGFSIDTTDEMDGKTPLHIAVERLQIETIKTLIKHGANPFAQDKHLRTPLHTIISIWVSSLSENPKQYKLLENFWKKQEKPDEAKCKTIAKLLLDTNSTLVNAVDEFDNTALHLACESAFKDCDNKNRVEIFKLLCDKNTNLSARNKQGLTPFVYAVAFNIPLKIDKEKVGKLLLPTKEQMDRNIFLRQCDVHGNNIAHYTILSPHQNTISVIDYLHTKSKDNLFRSQNNQGYSPVDFFRFLNAQNHESTAEALLSKKERMIVKETTILESSEPLIKGPFTLPKFNCPESLLPFYKELIANRQDDMTPSHQTTTPTQSEILFPPTLSQNNASSSVLPPPYSVEGEESIELPTDTSSVKEGTELTTQTESNSGGDVSSTQEEFRVVVNTAVHLRK